MATVEYSEEIKKRGGGVTGGEIESKVLRGGEKATECVGCYLLRQALLMSESPYEANKCPGGL